MERRRTASAENKQRRCSYSCRGLAWHSQNSNRRLVVRLIINIIAPIFASLRAALATLPLRPPRRAPSCSPFSTSCYPLLPPCTPCETRRPPCVSRYQPGTRPLRPLTHQRPFHPDPELVQLLPSSSQVLFSIAFPLPRFPAHPILIPSVVKCGRSQLRPPPHYASLIPPISRSFILSGARALTLVKTPNNTDLQARAWRHGQPRCSSAALCCVF